MKKVWLQLLLTKSSLSAVTDVVQIDACGSWINRHRYQQGARNQGPVLRETPAILNSQTDLWRSEEACGDGILHSSCNF